MSNYSDLLIGKTVQHFRKESTLSSAVLSSVLNIAQPTYSRIENGTSSLKVKDFIAFCTATNVSHNKFFKHMLSIQPKTRISI